MKLKNKKTGEIVSLQGELTYDDKVRLLTHYGSLAELNEEWEDYEEPKEHWTISGAGFLWTTEHMNSSTIEDLKEIGNYFETREEAEKAIKKLKAIKRLKDKGIRFGRRQYGSYGGELFWDCPSGMGVKDKQIWKDIYLLFGGEE